ncbi:DUF1631 domain-containing protein [Marinobacter bryozoorum]|uniref:DUF1631 family protein n=1 Tax=Marinobacter bryozoorum TaxID=256324 RepID=UPI0020057FE0|nr:DUF1631 family protein [Marinobacter bryozoorum]MCK7544671.1 DUF1631 domain-containing protein [Marinobacter bryozoorum]
MPEHFQPDTLSQAIEGVLREIRVPDLPYPVGEPPTPVDWGDWLQAQWHDQSDQRVSDLLSSMDGPWSVRQVNSAYLADRIMDVFLRSSGLHPVLVARLARLRYPLAWQFAATGAGPFLDHLVTWLDSFEDWRGWSDSGGRSSRALLDRLDRLVEVVEDVFATQSITSFVEYCDQWHAEARRRQAHSSRLHQRLLETEAGAARQRKADQASRAVAGRALEGRRVPPAIMDFLVDHWVPLLRQIAWKEGPDGDNWRHGKRLLEWMVWVGDPDLSSQNLERVYQVGEQLADRVSEVWQRIWQEPPPRGALAALEQVLVERLRGGEPEVSSTRQHLVRLDYDRHWLDIAAPLEEDIGRVRGQWFVKGSGDDEQRRYFLACFPETTEILWSNGFGVRLGMTFWRDFRQALEEGTIRPLPEQTRFGQVLEDTLTALGRVLESQRRQRQQAARRAREKAEQVRLQKEARERELQEAEARRQAEAEREQQQARERARQEEAARLEAARAAARDQAMTEVDRLGPGSWIALRTGGDNQERRLKLAVRINARRKLVFVDRLGLNRTELTIDQLVDHLLDDTARILGASAEFDETLSRVVGRIRLGR